MGGFSAVAVAVVLRPSSGRCGAHNEAPQRRDGEGDENVQSVQTVSVAEFAAVRGAAKETEARMVGGAFIIIAIIRSFAIAAVVVVAE